MTREEALSKAHEAADKIGAAITHEEAQIHEAAARTWLAIADHHANHPRINEKI